METFEVETINVNSDMEEYNFGLVRYLIYNFNNIVWFLENYGWFCLIFGLVLIYLYHKYVKEIIRIYLQRKSENEYAAKYHKDSDLFQERIINIQSHRETLQEKYNHQAEEFKKKEILREERKRQEWLEKHDDIGGNKLGSQQKSLKDDYNPLVGSHSRGYRPEKRSACSKGGCGK